MSGGNTTEILKQGFRSGSAESTLKLSSFFASELPADCFITLSGDLGAGKTTFVKGLAQGLGVKEMVKSPSFNIYGIYDTAGGGKLVHLDAYRLSGAEAFDDLLLDEIVPGDKIVCVEWPEMVADALPPDAYALKFDILEDGSHFMKLL